MTTMAATRNATGSFLDADDFALAENQDCANVTITEDELQEEFNLARYGNRYGKPGRNWEEDLKKVEEIRSRICLK